MDEIIIDPPDDPVDYEHHASQEITNAFLAFIRRCSPSRPKDQVYTDEELDQW